MIFTDGRETKSRNGTKLIAPKNGTFSFSFVPNTHTNLFFAIAVFEANIWRATDMKNKVLSVLNFSVKLNETQRNENITWSGTKGKQLSWNETETGTYGVQVERNGAR